MNTMSKKNVPVKQELEIAKVLTLSTSHITGEDDRKLRKKEDPNFGTWFALRYPGERDTVGYLVAVHLEVSIAITT